MRTRQPLQSRARRRRASVSRAAAAVLAAMLLAPACASAATRVPCPAHPGEVARSMGAALWVQDGQLYGCAPAVRSRVPEYRASQRSKIRLGRWSEGAVASVRNVDAVWTERTVAADGTRSDRIWAFDLRRGKAWLKGVTPLPPTPGGTQVVAVRAASDIAAWVTASGTVVMRARQTEEELVDLGIGGVLVGESDRSAAGAGLVPAEQLLETGWRVVVGAWPASVEAVASSLRFQIDEYVGSDEGVCSVTLVWKLTTRPVPGGPRVGATWAAGNDERPSDCSRPTLAR